MTFDFKCCKFCGLKKSFSDFKISECFTRFWQRRINVVSHYECVGRYLFYFFVCVKFVKISVCGNLFHPCAWNCMVQNASVGYSSAIIGVTSLLFPKYCTWYILLRNSVYLYNQIPSKLFIKFSFHDNLILNGK